MGAANKALMLVVYGGGKRIGRLDMLRDDAQRPWKNRVEARSSVPDEPTRAVTQSYHGSFRLTN